MQTDNIEQQPLSEYGTKLTNLKQAIDSTTNDPILLKKFAQMMDLLGNDWWCRECGEYNFAHRTDCDDMRIKKINPCGNWEQIRFGINPIRSSQLFFARLFARVRSCPDQSEHERTRIQFDRADTSTSELEQRNGLFVPPLMPTMS